MPTFLLTERAHTGGQSQLLHQTHEGMAPPAFTHRSEYVFIELSSLFTENIIFIALGYLRLMLLLYSGLSRYHGK